MTIGVVCKVCDFLTKMFSCSTTWIKEEDGVDVECEKDSGCEKKERMQFWGSESTYEPTYLCGSWWVVHVLVCYDCFPGYVCCSYHPHLALALVLAPGSCESSVQSAPPHPDSGPRLACLTNPWGGVVVVVADDVHKEKHCVDASSCVESDATDGWGCGQAHLLFVQTLVLALVLVSSLVVVDGLLPTLPPLISLF